MSVDSGLPDIRGSGGFWRAYPPLAKLEISFEEMAQPHWFGARPAMASAIYRHHQQLYRATRPRVGYSLLRDWARDAGRALRGHLERGRRVRGAQEPGPENRDPLVAVAGIEDRRLQAHSLGMAYLTPTDNEASDEP
jgi:hypothetical protein